MLTEEKTGRHMREKGIFRILKIEDHHFGASIKIMVETADGKKIAMGCKKSLFRLEFIGKLVEIEYYNPFEFGVFYQVLSLKKAEDS